jgi:hypothetical protein
MIIIHLVIINCHLNVLCNNGNDALLIITKLTTVFLPLSGDVLLLMTAKSKKFVCV